ncbi:MAG: tripartite tricarboxylate transporter substrate binding protein [Thermodesulfobacteriota bacterium]
MACVILLTLSLIGSPVVQAQEFPTKPITVINPMGAGGSHDLTMRAVVSVATDYLGQPMIVQIKSGGGGAIGSETVAKAAPDGYTLLAGGPGWNTTLPAVEGRSRGPEDLMAVCRINYSANNIVARADAPFKNLKEMVAWAKANPGKLIFGTSGTWGAADVPWKELMKKTGITSKVVPYDGGGPALVAILGGHIDVTASFAAQALPQVKAGKLRILAVLDDKRNPEFPDVPTAREQGIDVVYLMWRGILAPKGTPRPVIDKLGLAFKKMVEDKTVLNMLKSFGDVANYLGPDEFEKLWRAEYEQHKELVKLYKK